MQLFKSFSDIEQLPPQHPACSLLLQLHQHIVKSNTTAQRRYLPEHDGYIVLIEEDDTSRVLDDLHLTCTLAHIPWEGVTLQGGYFHAVYVPNNQYALSFLIPDQPWIHGSLRASLLAHLDD